MGHDNVAFRVNGRGKPLMLQGMAFVEAQNRGPYTHYAVRQPAPAGTYGVRSPAKPLRLVFFWADPKVEDAKALPFKLDAAGVVDWAERWLAEAEYGEEPDHDGSNGKGWLMYVEDWGHVDNQWEAAVAIAPQWLCYGK